MQIIDTEEKIDDLVKSLKESNLRASRVGFCGKIHDGHIHIFKNVRKSCDILIVDLVEYATYVWQYLLHKNLKTSYKSEFEDICKQVQELNFVDYLVYSKATPYHTSLADKLRDEFQDSFFEQGKLLGLSKDLCIHSFLYELVTPLDEVTTSYAGPKNIVQVLLARKIYGDKSRFHPELVWDFYRTPEGGSAYRSRGSLTLQKIVKNSIAELNKGKSDEQTFKNLMNEYFMQNQKFTIIDLNNLEKVSSITDNCTLVFMEKEGSDFIHIKKGDLIA